MHRRESIASSTSWSPPPPGSVLFMCDAAIFSELSKFGAGVVALNSDGQFVIACREANYGSPEPELAEACALRRVVNLAREMGRDSVIFASDCLSLVQRINSHVCDRSLVGDVVLEIKDGMSNTLISRVKFIRWQSNVLVHNIPKSCLSCNGLCVFTSTSECIRETLCNYVA